MRIWWIIVCGLVSVGLLPGVAHAHAFSITWADVTVTKEKVSATIRVLAEDFLYLQGAKLNPQNYVEADELTAAMQRHREFLQKYFVVVAGDDERLTGTITGVTPFEIPAEGIAKDDLMAHSVHYRLEFPLATSPSVLTIYHQFGSQEISWPAVMELNVTQQGFPPMEPVALDSDRPYSFRIDWDRPPVPTDMVAGQGLGRDNGPGTMGIASYGSVYSFIYITEYEVRHEILIPLVMMENWFPIERKDRYYLEIEEQDVAVGQIEEFFCQGNPVEIDGIEVKPILSRVDFLGLDIRDLAQLTERRRLRVATARVGVILSYPTKGAPSRVKMACDMLDWGVNKVRSTVYAYDDVQQIVFTRYKPTFEWTSPGRPPLPQITQLVLPPPPTRRLPVVSLACLALLLGTLVGLRFKRSPRKSYLWAVGILGLCAAGSWPLGQVEVPDPLAPRATLSEHEARSVFSALHKNIYRAFDYHTESDIYDALAKSVGGELLSDLYLQIHKGLVMQEQGGAVSRVQEVVLVEGQKAPRANRATSDSPGFDYQCTWTVEGTVEHWGHLHTRTNQYRAMFAVRTEEDAWKITDVELLDEKRLKFESQRRGPR